MQGLSVAILTAATVLTLALTSCWSKPMTPGTPSPTSPPATTVGTVPSPTPPTVPAIPTGAPPSQACQTPPAGSFATVYDSSPGLSKRLGCATAAARSLQAAGEDFQNGTMFWRGDERSIYVLYSGGGWAAFPDTFKEGEQESRGETPPAGLFEPIRGFGKVWREQPTVRPKLGWAIEKERGFPATLQPFAHGAMFSDDRQTVYVVVDDGSWQKSAAKP